MLIIVFDAAPFSCYATEGLAVKSFGLLGGYDSRVSALSTVMFTRESPGATREYDQKIEDMLVCPSSLGEQPVLYKRPNKSACQKKGYCQLKQDSIEGDIDLLSFAGMVCVLLAFAPPSCFSQ